MRSSRRPAASPRRRLCEENGFLIPNATNSTLVFNPAQPSDAADYTVTAMNVAGSDTSPDVTVTVNSTMTPLALFPPNGATNVCTDTPLKLTFNVPVVVGLTGAVTIYTMDGTPVDVVDLSLDTTNGPWGGLQSRSIGGTAYNTYPIMNSIYSSNTVIVYPHLGSLTKHHLLRDGGQRDARRTRGHFRRHVRGHRFQRLDLTTKPVLPDPLATNLVTAADGTGDFCTIQGTLEFLYGNLAQLPVFVNLRNGVYQEIVRTRSASTNLTFRGQDRKQTIITYPNSANIQPGGSTSLRCLVNVIGADFTLENLTLTNSTARGGGSAEALRTQSSRLILDITWYLNSFADVLLVNSAGNTVYLNKSHVQGDGSLVWGTGTAFLQSCDILSLVNGSVTGPRTATGQYGFIFADCTLNRATQYAPPPARSELMPTPPGRTGNVAYLNCEMDAHITAAGWGNGGLADKSTLRFWEYQSTDLTGTNLINVSARASWSLQLDDATAASLRDMNTVFAGLWLPQLPPYFGSQPANQAATTGQAASLTCVSAAFRSPINGTRAARCFPAAPMVSSPCPTCRPMTRAATRW